jgi:hypothetical protein
MKNLSDEKLSELIRKEWTDGVRVIIIDEASLLDIKHIYRVQQLCNQVSLGNSSFSLLDSKLKDKYPFGRFLVILVGDIRQLPPIKGSFFWESSIRKYVLESPSESYNEVTTRKGQVVKLIYKQIRYGFLVGQARAAGDVAQSSLVEAISVLEFQSPMTDSVMETLQRKTMPIEEFPLWIDALYPTSTNAERTVLSYHIGLYKAKQLDVPFIVWHNQIVSPANLNDLSPDAMSAFCQGRIQLLAFFFETNLGHLNAQDKIRNLKTTAGVVNGAPVKQMRLVFDLSNPEHAIASKKIDSARGFQIIDLGDLRPIAIEVLLVDAVPDQWPVDLLSSHQMTTVGGQVVECGVDGLPATRQCRIMVSTTNNTDTIKNYKSIPAVEVLVPGMDIGQGITTYKLQGITATGGIVPVFNQQPTPSGKNMTMEDVVVCVSRCRRSQDWKLFPIHSAGNLNHMRDLKFNENTVVFSKIINPTTGLMDPTLLTDENRGSMAKAGKTMMTTKKMLESFLKIEGIDDKEKRNKSIGALLVPDLKAYIQYRDIKSKLGSKPSLKPQLIAQIVDYLNAQLDPTKKPTDETFQRLTWQLVHSIVSKHKPIPAPPNSGNLVTKQSASVSRTKSVSNTKPKPAVPRNQPLQSTFPPNMQSPSSLILPSQSNTGLHNFGVSCYLNVIIQFFYHQLYLCMRNSTALDPTGSKYPVMMVLLTGKNVDELSSKLWRVMLDMDKNVRTTTTKDERITNWRTLVDSLHYAKIQVDVAEAFFSILNSSNLNLQSIFESMLSQSYWTIETDLEPSTFIRDKPNVSKELYVQLDVNKSKTSQVLGDNFLEQLAFQQSVVRRHGSNEPNALDPDINANLVSTLVACPVFLTFTYKLFQHHGITDRTRGTKLFPKILYTQFLSLEEAIGKRTLPGAPIFISSDLIAQKPTYELVCIYLHRGNTLHSGHYTCFVKCGNSDVWNYCNDERVVSMSYKEIETWEQAQKFLLSNLVTKEDVRLTTPYVFIYRKVDYENDLLVQTFGKLLITKLKYCYFF